MSASQNLNVNWTNVPTRTITAGGVEFAYRELGTNNPGTPVVFLVHLAAVLDNWDPRVVDGFAATRRVITFDNRGVGASSGSPATSIEQMAKDAITFIKAMGFEQVDLFGFSMGGMIAQELVLMQPQLVRKMIIAGTGPAGGEGISKVARVTYLDMARGFLTHQDPKQFLFFTRTPGGIRAGKEFLARLEERSQNRDKEATVTVLQAQLKALRRWGSKEPADCQRFSNRCLSQTAIAIAWFQPRTRTIWRGVFRIATSSSTPMPDTAGCSSSMRTSCPRRSNSLHDKYSSVRVRDRRGEVEIRFVSELCHIPLETPGTHRDLRRHADVHRCFVKSLIGSALVGFGMRQHARRRSISKRARSTTPTSLRFRINELRAVWI
jgi:pimeloyl-ACP methyl ester carboxylesterase